MSWDKATDIILYAAIAVMVVFAGIGLYQWITRKSLKKVDTNLLAMFIPLALMAVVYIVFDKFLPLNYRPDGSGEPSFPSTHAMVVATIFAVVAINLKKYVKNKSLRVVLYILMLALTATVSAGRVLANKHWISDVVAGLIFAAIFATIYYLIIRRTKNAQHLHENH